jgi:hypothetical protein
MEGTPGYPPSFNVAITMKYILTSIFIITTLLLGVPGVCYAYTSTVSSSAQIKKIKVIDNSNYRVNKLKTYLESHNSPLSEHSYTFVAMADKYNLDWRLVVAISGVESTFGKRIPFNSYNAYGWANGNYNFESWDQSIEVVSKTLREKYIDQGATSIDEIAAIYAPPSDTWAWKVRFFMNEIDPMPLTFSF